MEGIIDRCVRGLEQDQPVRRVESTQMADQIDAFVVKLKALKEVVQPFTLVSSGIGCDSSVSFDICQLSLLTSVAKSNYSYLLITFVILQLKQYFIWSENNKLSNSLVYILMS